MKNSMSKKHRVMAAVVAAVVVVGGVTAMLSSSGKKEAAGYYDDLKEKLGIQDLLQEGDVSYSVFSGNLTVESPEIRLVTAQSAAAQGYFRTLSGLLDSARGASVEEGLAAWSNYQLRSANGNSAAGVYIKADALKISRKGDSKDGVIHLQLLGLDMSNPYIASKGSEVVLVSDVSDEVQPRAEMDQYGAVVKSLLPWGNNIVSHTQFTGSFLTAATGAVGNTVDLDFTLKRSSDGEGSMSFVVVHRNDGSEVGRIVREAEFASLPALDDVQDLLHNAMNGFVVGALSEQMGRALFADAAGTFARKTKASEYSLTYKGFKQLKEDFSDYKASTGQDDFAGFCESVDLSLWKSDFGAKDKDHSDSECAIAEKLVDDGEFKERYKFKEEKSLFADIFVSKGYELETN